ncbi:ABC transporter permease subunit [Thermogutta sp.]|uniref:ABC transporter permease subunit n=1 Tax=Thermogutta sp. TaxID=1962930 RepID=UPI00321FED8E
MMDSSSRRGTRVIRWIDRIAAWIVTLGGISTIVAVLGVFVFLVWTVLPMFRPASLSPRATVLLMGETPATASSVVETAGESHSSQNSSDAPRKDQGDQTKLEPSPDVTSSEPLVFGLDESVSVLWGVSRTGIFSVWELQYGQLVHQIPLAESAKIVCVAVDAPRRSFVLGTQDGKLLSGSFTIQIGSVPEEDVPPQIKSQWAHLAGGKQVVSREGTVWWPAEGSVWRSLQVSVSRDEPVVVGDRAVVLVDSSFRGETRLFAALTEDGVLYVGTSEKKLNFLTGEETLTFAGGSLRLQAELGEKFPAYLCMSGVGDSVYLLWRDGRLLRVDTRMVDSPQVAETLRVTHGNDTVTAFGQLIGKNSLLIGTREGDVSAWFPIKPESANTPDGVQLVRGHLFRKGPAAAVCFGPSQRSRLFSVAYSDGTVRVFHATSEQLVVEDKFAPQGTGPALQTFGQSGALSDVEKMWKTGAPAVVIGPKEDALIAVEKHQARLWRLAAPHAGITLRSVFGRVWYEGYSKPEFVWQSSSGTDDFEPKYSLTPLIFGTVKATAFALLFAVPLALLAAVYTSEVLHKSVRAYIKPSLELMAGLPSVVLGFLAALVFAPWVETRLPQVLAVFYTVPFALLLGGHLIRVLPRSWQFVVSRYRFWTILAACAVGVALANYAGPLAEKAFFQGDIKAWLNGRVGTGAPGWAFALLPLMGVLVAAAQILWIEPTLERFLPLASHRLWAWTKLGLFLFGVLAAFFASFLLGWLLVNILGLDPRGLFLGTYVQRNAFIVGFVMGFAIIPIIYTIADDALSAVPDHLRAASLGAGATPWQTAIRVVIPTAMSGLFSALMIGLGRAAGETMIVLMAAGNTPIMDWNIFSGFRTLSANIAVELPEAVQYSTHYRMLFLAGLCLFVITFIVNTVAELVRLRFRKKAFQL